MTAARLLALALFSATLASTGLACASQAPHLVQFVLGEDGAGGVVIAPRRAAVKASRDQVVINAGQRFEVMLERGHLDLQREQARIIDAHRLSLQEFEVHSEDTLVWRLGPVERYQFVYVGSLAGEPFHCRSGDRAFSRADIEQMLAACRDVRPVEDE